MILKLIDFPEDFQEDEAFFISVGKSHFCAAYRLMQLPALDCNGISLKKKDGTIYITLEYLHSALVLFQFAFELLIKSLIKLKSKPYPQRGWEGHNLQKLWDLAVVDFPILCSIQENDLKILKELSSDPNFMRWKYGKSSLSLSEGVTPLLESFSRIYKLVDGAIQAVCSDVTY